MINHARTLLLNRSGANRPANDFYLEELIEPTFSPILLAQDLAETHRTLVETGCDDAFANFRLHQYMKLLHGTEFEKYVTALDARVTYVRPVYSSLKKSSRSISAINALATGIVGILSGTIELLEAPRLFNTWNIEVLSATEVTTKHLESGLTNQSTISIISGQTSPFPLAGQSNFFARLSTAAPPVGGRWRVESFEEPTDDVTDVIARLEGLSPGAKADLFPPREPFKTFKKLWEHHALVPYRLDGLLLAFIYRVEEVRTGG